MCSCTDTGEPCPTCEHRISRAQDERDWSDDHEGSRLTRYERHIWRD